VYTSTVKVYFDASSTQDERVMQSADQDERLVWATQSTKKERKRERNVGWSSDMAVVD